ncbi:MAG TPA: TIGR03435 family protein [Bryobacteraceae bacterium]|jgi:uncharacterized protein (TIGR03435 family)|nr:TIGR03435 family protein [Bryobacteraceae bacterium]
MTLKPFLRGFQAVMMFASIVGSGQAQLASDSSFEAASIKLNRTGANSRLSMTPGRITFRSATLKECVMAAYDLRSYQVAGPSLLTAERYDIDAAAGGPASDSELRAMLKRLLGDRFGLMVHTEKRELPAYVLLTAKNGPKLTTAKTEGKGGYALDGGSVVFHSTSMMSFADYLSHRGPIDRPVFDRTGIDGSFDFQLKLFDVKRDIPLDALKRAYFEWDQGTSIFTDVQEQLGLKLQPERVPVDVLIVDTVAKPSEN